MLHKIQSDPIRLSRNLLSMFAHNNADLELIMRLMDARSGRLSNDLVFRIQHSMKIYGIHTKYKTHVCGMSSEDLTFVKRKCGIVILVITLRLLEK